MQRGGDLSIAPLVSAHDPVDGCAGETGGAGVTQHEAPAEVSQEPGIELEPLHFRLGVVELQPQKAAVRGGELVLPATWYARLDRLEVACPLRDFYRIGTLPPSGR